MTRPAELRLGGGRLDLLLPAGLALTRLEAVVRLAGGRELTSSRWRRAGSGYAVRCGPLSLTLGCRGSRIARLRLEGRAIRPAQVVAVGLRGMLGLAGARGQVLYNGYQSWDVAGLSTAAAVDSWWTCGVTAGPEAVALAARSALRHASRFEVRDDVLTWLNAPPAGAVEGAEERLGEEVAFRGEELAVASGPDLGRQLGRAAGGRPARRTAPRGWLSWYHHGPGVTAQDLLANSELVASGRAGTAGYGVLQLDDGWQNAYGDWVPNTKFAPLDRLCTALAARGQTAGIWTAPFLVSVSSDLDAQAPEGWFLQDPRSGGRLVDDRHTVFGPMHVLDARNPRVLGHLEQVFGRLRGDGFRYFKIDFLYAGACAGLPAFRAALRAIRRGAGADAYIVACGSPLLPAAGLVEACRIGPDTCTPFFDLQTGDPMPTVFGDEIEAVARNVAARRHLAGWFQLDPDVAVAGGNLTAAQARQLVTAVVLCGGLYFISDDLRSLAEDRLALLANPRVLALLGGPAADADFATASAGKPPALWRRPDGVLAVFNWSAAAQMHRVAALGRAVRVDLWTGAEHLGDEVEVPAGDVLLLAPARGRL